MNIYRHQFAAKCPNNGKTIFYSLEIRTTKKIYVEHIVIACELWGAGYHEQIADSLAKQFPGTEQILRAHHHGVDIETQRGPV